jgi:hypothetical protein
MIEEGCITIGDKTMRLRYFIKGTQPANGYSLLFGMHGGGGCASEVNEQQYNNHMGLYDAFLP